MVQYVVAMLSYSLRSKADNEMQNRHLRRLRQTYLFILINDAIVQGEMLIMLRSDPLRWVDLCIHLYLLFFFSSKRLSCRQNLWGFALFWSCKLTLMSMFYHDVAWWKRLCVFMKCSLFLKITWVSVNERKRGEAKKPRAVLASETKPCVDEIGIKRFKPDYTAINVLCVCPWSLMSRLWSLRTQQHANVSAIQLEQC